MKEEAEEDIVESAMHTPDVGCRRNCSLEPPFGYFAINEVSEASSSTLYVDPRVEHGGEHQLSRSRLACNKQAIDGSTAVVEP